MKKYRYIFMLVFCLVNSVIVFSKTDHKKIRVADFTGYKFFPNKVTDIRSMKDGIHYTMLDRDRYIIRYSYGSGLAVDTLYSANWNTEVSYFTDYQFSADESKILIMTDKQPIYRHSFIASYYVYDRKTRILRPLSLHGKQQLASFSPSSDKVAFVRDNNIYIVDLNTWKEKEITTDGKRNAIINGAPDWVYEEEFEFSKGYHWSPDGSKLAFMRFDERKVKMYTLTFYDSLYPTEETYKYPKAGETNSIVSVKVYDLNTGLTAGMDVGTDTDQYIPRILWTGVPNKLCILRLNRRQNKIEALLDDAITGKSIVIYKDTNKRFISGVNDQFLTFLKSGKSFVVFSDRDGYRHLYWYSIKGKLKNRITNDPRDVDALLGIDEARKTLYYLGWKDSPIERQVFSVHFDGTGEKKITRKPGVHHAEFSKSCSYFIDTWSDANTPPVVYLKDNKNRTIKVLEENKNLRTLLTDYGFARTQFMKIPTSDHIRLNAYMIKPLDFDSTRQYPLFMYVYGGPESQEVMDKWNYQAVWFQMLVQHGYIVACVDNRGTDGRGEEFRKCTYMHLGKYETEDQLNAARYLGNLSYIDKSRIGIFGWSYGGYMASLCMLKGADIFKMGIAVAPVTSWRFYDSVYTERYMRKPSENEKGYDEYAPVNCADKLKGKFLLIHGSADDNVHLQNTMEFVKKLIQYNKIFDMAIYPNKNHGIYGGNTRLNLYTRMTDFILKNL